MRNVFGLLEHDVGVLLGGPIWTLDERNNGVSTGTHKRFEAAFLVSICHGKTLSGVADKLVRLPSNLIVESCSNYKMSLVYRTPRIPWHCWSVCTSVVAPKICRPILVA